MVLPDPTVRMDDEYPKLALLVIDEIADVTLEPFFFAVYVAVVVEPPPVNVIVSTSFDPVFTTTFVIFADPFLPLLDVIVIVTEFLLPEVVKTLLVIVPSLDDKVPLDTLLNVNF